MSEISDELEARMAAKIANAGEPLADENDEAATAAAAAAADDSGGIADIAKPAGDEAAADDEGGQPEQLIFGKYKTMDEAERAFGHLESKLGEQGTELGETRQRLERLEQGASQPQYDRDRLDEWLDENIVAVPQLAEEARKRGDSALFDAAVDKWYEVAPRQAAAYERHIEQAEMRRELTAQTEAQVAAPMRVSEAQQTAVASLTSKFDDFAEVMGGMTDERIAEVLQDPTFPTEFLLRIDPSDPAAQEQLLGTLYRFVKAEQVGPLSEAAKAAVQVAAADARDAKREGTLPSPSGTRVQEKIPDEALALKNAFRKDFGLPLLEQ